jgi:hypothetical protein
MALKRSLAAAISLTLLGSGLVVASSDSPAQAADLGTVSINCDLVGIAGATIVATGGVGDTFVIDNTGSTNNCLIAATDLLTGEDANHDGVGLGVVSTAVGVSDPITIEGSGSFTISSSTVADPTVEIAGSAETFVIDACSLEGAGVAASPWQVGDEGDLNLVGYVETSTDDDLSGYVDSCVPSGHYLQTANIANVDTYVDGTEVSNAFTGTYDGDHYDISFFSGGATGSFRDRDPLFATLGPEGIIRKLSLSGNIRNSATNSSSLVDRLYGGTISEVRSSVLIQVDDDNDAVIGGLAARSGGTDRNGSIIYSKFDGRIEWLESVPGARQEGPVIGGLVGMARGTGTTEIRDSYSRAAISFNSRGLTPSTGSTHRAAAVFAGGLVGSDGFTEIDDGGDNTTTFNANNRSHVPSSVRIVRSYFAGSFANTCVGTAAFCNLLDGSDPSHVFTGGLIGVSEGRDDAGDLLVSSFWLSTSATNAVGGILVSAAADPLVYTAAQPLDYTASSPALPEAPGLSASVLRTLSTYQSRENSTTSGQPSGLTDLVEGSSNTVSVTEEDYRWAIEGGNIQTFVASSYGDEADFLTRSVYGDPLEEKTYRREGAGVLTVHGGSDSRTVIDYPRLGRVWEICANSNDGYPFLVWEELDCRASGGGGNPGGLSDAEYAEFLRSGLTLADFLARRLAATGPSDAALGLGGLSAVLLGLVGAALVLIARRQVSRKPR